MTPLARRIPAPATTTPQPPAEHHCTQCGTTVPRDMWNGDGCTPCNTRNANAASTPAMRRRAHQLALEKLGENHRLELTRLRNERLAELIAEAKRKKGVKA